MKSVTINDVVLDSHDIKILKLLQQDCTLTIKDLASMVALSPTPVHKRVKKLERAGIIKSYVALVDPKKVDQGLIVFVNIKLKEHSHDVRHEVVERMTAFHQVVELHHTTGTYDFIAKIRIKDIEAYRDFLLNQMSTIEMAKDIDGYIVLESPKLSTALLFD